jgi:hypothetical protein
MVGHGQVIAACRSPQAHSHLIFSRKRANEISLLNFVHPF